ncbi:MAG: flavin reductase family protein [Ruminococcaceae bacterium]|nr:flavin reductase family protein [Oscillospiraceae bacterium]
METFKKITPQELVANPFSLIGNNWMLVGAQKDNKVNAMTASWGGVGIMWGKPVAYVVLRPQRYTKEFVDTADTFSLSFPDDSHRDALNYFGTVSGRDEDKIAKSGLAVGYEGDTPYFADAHTVLICKKLYAQTMQPDCFIDADIDRKCYPNHDYHTMYIAEIEQVLVKA